MKQEHSPLRVELHLTPALQEHYMARARVERAKAIAEFTRWLAAWVLRRVCAAPTAPRADHAVR